MLNVLEVKGLPEEAVTVQINQVVDRTITGPGSTASRPSRARSNVEDISEAGTISISRIRSFKLPNVTVKITGPGAFLDRRRTLDEEIFCISRNTPVVRGQVRFKVIVQDYKRISAVFLENAAMIVMAGYRIMTMLYSNDRSYH